MSILSSLVVMSVKYDFHDVRSEIVKHLMHHFPSKLADFEREKENNLQSNLSLSITFAKHNRPLSMGKHVYKITIMHPNEPLVKHNLSLCMGKCVYEILCLMTSLTVFSEPINESALPAPFPCPLVERAYPSPLDILLLCSSAAPRHFRVVQHQEIGLFCLRACWKLC